MDILTLIASWVAFIVMLAWRAGHIAAVGLGLWALVDSLSRDPEHFVAADKRTKGFWLGVNGAGLAVCLIFGFASMLGLIGVVANGVYLADVRPALKVFTPVKARGTIRPIDPSKRRPRPDERGWRR